MNQGGNIKGQYPKNLDYPIILKRVAIAKDLCRKDFDLIASKMESYFNVSKFDLIKRDRHTVFVLPRQVCFYIMREVGHIWGHIAEVFGRHHTTVMYGYDCIKDLHDIVEKGYGNAQDIEIVEQIQIVLKEVWLENHEQV